MALPFFPRRTVTAAQAPVVSGSAQTRATPVQKPKSWQSDAMRYADEIGIVGYAAWLTENLIARIDWHLTYDGKRVENPLLDLDRLAGGNGFGALAGRAAWFYFVTGEAYLILLDGPEWLVVSGDAITWDATRKVARVKRREAGSETVTVDGKRVRRIWTPAHRFDQDATSPVQTVADDCERYQLLNRNMSAVADSRLLQNGIWWIPAEALQTMNDDGKVTDDSPVIRGYYDVAQKAYARSRSRRGPADVAAMAPFPMWWSHEFGPPQQLDFGHATEDAAVAQRQEAKEAIAQGLPIPSLILLEGPGAGGNHWGDLLADEQTFRQGLAPFADRVAFDFAGAMIRPLLRAMQMGDADRFDVAYSPAPILIPPDSRADALRLFDLGLVSAEYVLAAYGIDPADAGLPIVNGRATPVPAGSPDVSTQPAPPAQLQDMVPSKPVVRASLPSLFEVR